MKPPEKNKKVLARRGSAAPVAVKIPEGRMLLPDGTIRSWPGETILVPPDIAEEHQTTTELLAALQAGTPLTMADWHRFATSPPMTGNRLYITVAQLSRFSVGHLARVKRTLRARKGAENLRRKNAARLDAADARVRNAFNSWCAKCAAVLGDLTLAEKLKKYRKSKRLEQRDSRRLGKLLTAGLLSDQA